MKLVDDFLNKITMYRLVLYKLIGLLIIAVIFSFFHLLPYSPLTIIISSLFLFFFGGFVNDIFSKVFEAPVNLESTYITALILALIITPAKSLNDFLFLAMLTILANASKYILAIGKKHLFNPVAIAVVLTAAFANQSASWWVGNLYLTPFVIVGGLLIVRKIKREDLILGFLATTLSVITIFTVSKSNNLFSVFNEVLFHSPLFFFAFIMLTEPLTTPPTKIFQIAYGIIAGILFSPQIHFGSFYLTPELTLIIANLFSYLVSPEIKLVLNQVKKLQISPDIYDFIFPLKKRLDFVPGQYLEWTLPHKNIDNRGSRRYFTITSSPTEDNLRIGIKFYTPSSSYKKTMLTGNNNTFVASQLAGEFTLPKNKQEKLVFLAGGIGITPFRSMLKYLIDTGEIRDIVVFYSNSNPSEVVYKDVFDEAEKKLGIKVIYVFTQTMGRINEKMIVNQVSDYKERLFYISGPHNMVEGFKTVLKNIKVQEKKIKTDYFPGFV